MGRLSSAGFHNEAPSPEVGRRGREQAAKRLSSAVIHNRYNKAPSPSQRATGWEAWGPPQISGARK